MTDSQVILKMLAGCVCSVAAAAGPAAADPLAEPMPAVTYRHLTVEETDGLVVGTVPVPESNPPRWARDVPQTATTWPAPTTEPFFRNPIPFVNPPADAAELFHSHNHQPAITWLPNGDLLAIWYSTSRETGTELTVLASRLR